MERNGGDQILAYVSILSATGCWLQTVDSAKYPAMSKYLLWQCLKCGFAIVKENPPEKCPDCDAQRVEFVLVEED